MAKSKCALQHALEFVKRAQLKRGDALQTHVRLANHMVVAFDRVLAIGHPIVEDLNICVNSAALTELLKQATGTAAFTQEDAATLKCQFDGVLASIPCVNPAVLPVVTPDPKTHDASAVLKGGFKTWGDLITSGESIAESSMLLTENSMVVTDRRVLVEFWHGLNFPKAVVVPKAFVKAVAAAKPDITGIGYGPQTVTVHFANGAWIQTQTYKEGWPAYAKYMDNGEGAKDIDGSLFVTIEKVMAFARDKRVFCSAGSVHSHDPNLEAVSMTMGAADAPTLFWFPEAALVLKNHVTKMKYVDDDDARKRTLYFFSRRVRAVVLNAV